MSIYDSITDFHAKNFFTNENFTGERVIVAYKSDWDNAKTVPLMVSKDHLQGSNEVRGDGVHLERETGRTVRESILVEFKKPSKLMSSQPRQKPDRIKIVSSGKVFTAIRKIGDDASQEVWLFSNVVDLASRGQSRRG